jgi:hypothetical protein
MEFFKKEKFHFQEGATDEIGQNEKRDGASSPSVFV